MPDIDETRQFMHRDDGKRTIGEVPPGARYDDSDGSNTAVDFPMWMYWTRIAAEHASEAADLRLPDEQLDGIADAIASGGPSPQTAADDGLANRSVRAAMVAIVAAAVAVDGFFGTMVSDEVGLKKKGGPRAARYSVIVETLKMGFALGQEQRRLSAELKWLFKLRDRAVHHSSSRREVVVVRETDRTVLYGPPETGLFTPENARRAVDVALDLILACLANPKSQTAAFATRHLYLTRDLLQGTAI
ncbi:MAG: hypothetical protein JHC95_04635 [Solirubrobacteraceae bacterium]|nr:hypothetical protein [Solirubrobacteraceae bacterium]